jgi:hypothetical protein
LNKLKVVYLDGSEQETTAGARAEVEFERKFEMAFTDAFHARVKGEPRGRQEWLYFLAWASLSIDGLVSDEAFDDWLKRVDDINVLNGSEPDPTRRDRRPENSSSSAS